MAKKSKKEHATDKPFLSDVKTLRERARKHIGTGAVGTNYVGDVKKTIEILQSVLATELVCVLRYTQHAIAGSGISSEGVKAEFAEHAKDEWGHANEVAERINQLGGTPNFSPDGILMRSASQFAAGKNLVDMIRENLVAERIAVDHYRELIRYFGNDDPGTKNMLEGILRKEEEHADDMHDLLIAHEGQPMLKK
jgi:bacterioferritin